MNDDLLLTAARVGNLAPIHDAMHDHFPLERALPVMVAAAEAGQRRVVRALLLHVLNDNDRGQALTAAAGRGHLDIVELLAPLTLDHANAVAAAKVAGQMEALELLRQPPKLASDGERASAHLTAWEGGVAG